MRSATSHAISVIFGDEAGFRVKNVLADRPTYRRSIVTAEE
jgi:hypothetical protein